ncbi:EAL domain-containing protein [Blastococcus saxobsidens]|uniref:sensor domain-containing phosphodiesterase n=1 Tax=Blastococcus saxobsidens TaxID=138336 RepID=UPI0006883EC4|nr:EAL domain-containing protein [Blastococcus saxobsidens]
MDGPLDRVLQLARRHLGMDLAFVAEFTDGRQVYRALDGDAATFGWELDDGPPLAETYCRLMTTGQIPNAVPDTSADSRVRDLPVTTEARIGAYVGVPIRLADGTLYGSFCCLSHEAHRLDSRDVGFLSMLAELVTERVEAQRQRDVSRHQIHDLLEQGRIEIALQPIIDANHGHLLGVEALSRFPASYGPPDVVFEAAHEAGLGLELEGLAVRQAFAVLPLLGPDQYLAVNLIPSAAFQFASHVEAHPDLPYHRLVLEITEHVAVDGYAQLRDRLKPARERGLRVAIDDAGAGYASLHHVVELAPDIIKIDRSLIDGMAEDRARRSVVTAFVALACDIGAALVAEGVERPADFDAARSLGVAAAQGYLLARPSTNRADLARWVSDGITLPGRLTAADTPVAHMLPAAVPRRRALVG